MKLLFNNSSNQAPEIHKISFTDARFFSRVKRFFGLQKKEFIPSGLSGKYYSFNTQKFEQEIDKPARDESGEASRTENYSLSSNSINRTS